MHIFWSKHTYQNPETEHFMMPVNLRTFFFAIEVFYASRQQNKVFLLFDQCKKPCRSFTPLLLTTITLESLFPVCWSLATTSTRWEAACALHLVPRWCLRCSNRRPARTCLIVCVAHHCARSFHTGGLMDESVVVLLNPNVMRDFLWQAMR